MFLDDVLWDYALQSLRVYFQQNAAENQDRSHNIPYLNSCHFRSRILIFICLFKAFTIVRKHTKHKLDKEWFSPLSFFFLFSLNNSFICFPIRFLVPYGKMSMKAVNPLRLSYFSSLKMLIVHFRQERVKDRKFPPTLIICSGLQEQNGYLIETMSDTGKTIKDYH